VSENLPSVFDMARCYSYGPTNEMRTPENELGTPHTTWPFLNYEIAANKIHRIGRITEGLLLAIARKVDIVEPIAKFSDNLQGKDGIGKIFNVGLEDWSPQESEESKYDLIWNQWCLGHLTDAQLTAYLEKCQKVLNEDGLIIVKENLSTSGEDVFDELDSSVTRYVISRCNELKARMLNGIGVIRSSGIFSRKLD